MESRFQRLTREPGGKPRDLALADAETAVQSLSDIGLKLIGAHIDVLHKTPLKPGSDDGGRGDRLTHAYALTVEIAEVASIFRLSEICDVATSFAELLFRMKGTGTLSADSYQVHVEALRIAFASIDDEQARQNARVLAEHLRKVVDKLPDPDALDAEGHTGS